MCVFVHWLEQCSSTNRRDEKHSSQPADAHVTSFLLHALSPQRPSGFAPPDRRLWLQGAALTELASEGSASLLARDIFSLPSKTRHLLQHRPTETLRAAGPSRSSRSLSITVRPIPSPRHRGCGCRCALQSLPVLVPFCGSPVVLTRGPSPSPAGGTVHGAPAT